MLDQQSFYVTLDSLPSTEFPNNTNSIFQKRLPILLDLTRPRWQVAMVSLFLPDAGNQSTIDSKTLEDSVEIAEFEMESINADGDLVTVKKTITQKNVLDKIGSDATPRQIMHMIVGMYEYRRLQVDRGLSFIHTVPSHPKLNRLDLQFKWKINGDLLLDNSETYLGSLGPDVSFDVFFALKMGWLVRTENGYNLGPNLSFDILKHSNGSNRQSTDLDGIWVAAGLGSRSLTS